MSEGKPQFNPEEFEEMSSEEEKITEDIGKQAEKEFLPEYKSVRQEEKEQEKIEIIRERLNPKEKNPDIKLENFNEKFIFDKPMPNTLGIQKEFQIFTREKERKTGQIPSFKTLTK